jgi:L,D-transpeptidase ErfK/SrfK
VKAWLAIPLCVACLAAAPHQAPSPDAPVLVGAVIEYQVAAGESWVSIGARAGVTPSTLARRNGQSPNKPLRAGDTITIDARHIAPVSRDGVPILINVPQRLLFVRAGGVTAHFPVAVGRHDWPTPLGAFTIREREENPTWDVPISIQEEMRREGHRVLTKVPPGPDNPLGRYWLGLTLPGVGIHGTNVPTSIYRSTTHGCIRMHPDDIAALFAQVALGEAGRTIYDTVLVAATPDRRVFLEVHPDIYRRAPRQLDLALDLLDRAGVRDLVDRDDVARTVAAREGIAIELAFHR